MPGNRAKRETEAGERQVPVETELKNEFSGKKPTWNPLVMSGGKAKCEPLLNIQEALGSITSITNNNNNNNNT